MELDLNQEPFDSSHDSLSGLGSSMNNLETAHECIEERIRRLEAVTYRARQRQRWRQSQTVPQTVSISLQPTIANVHNYSGLPDRDVRVASQERTFGTGSVGNTSSTYLIARALDMVSCAEEEAMVNCAKEVIEACAKEAGNKTANLFDCNICLDMARDPILTCCGHLFCWPCFYQLSFTYSNVKECPVCEGEVADTSIIPIYGNGNGSDTDICNLKECGFKVPPRPRAQRIMRMIKK